MPVMDQSAALSQPESQVRFTKLMYARGKGRAVMDAVHYRMPVILSENQFSGWLDEEDTSTELLLAMIKPHPGE